MTLALISDLSRNLLARTLVATAAVFLFLGFATGALPVKCLTQGLTVCGAVPNVPASDPSPAKPVQPINQDRLPATEVAAIEPAAPSITHNDVIAQTFEALNIQLQGPDPDKVMAPTTRAVRTVAIRADGLPETGPVAPAVATPVVQVAAANVAPLTPATKPQTDAPDTAAAALAEMAGPTPEDSPDRLALVEDPAPTKVLKPSKPKGNFATVLGNGANVRSSPSKGKSSVLFALNGGTKVTVTDNQHGWIRVTDPKGRSGWIYRDYLRM